MSEIDLNHIIDSFSTNRYAMYLPGKTSHSEGFESCLLTGNTPASLPKHKPNHITAGLIPYTFNSPSAPQAWIPFNGLHFFDVSESLRLPGPVTMQAINNNTLPKIRIRPLVTKARYIETVENLKKHIARGDIYEINFCMEFRAEAPGADPLHLFMRLYHLTGAPFSCLFKYDTKYILCASPERYLKRAGSILVSQPIKGTRPRGITEKDDQQQKQELADSPKERSENIMIVDLVRNDLGRIAKRGSVCVDELCGIYSFPTVHQMISTVRCELADGISLQEILTATFPMGSMTGAPKISAMKFIETSELSARGAFSGSLGYIKENGDFDFNVVIRSIIYDTQTGQLSFSVGSAITHYAHAEEEYNECMVKARALLRALGSD